MTDPRINARLKEIRKSEQLNQTDFAIACGSHQTVIARIEKGERDLTIDIILNLMKNLGYRSDYILLGTLPKKRTERDDKEDIAAVLQNLKTQMEIQASRIGLLEKKLAGKR